MQFVNDSLTNCNVLVIKFIPAFGILDISDGKSGKSEYCHRPLILQEGAMDLRGQGSVDCDFADGGTLADDVDAWGESVSGSGDPDA